MDLFDSFLKFTQSDVPVFRAKEPILLALSGGLDSMVMLDLFRLTNHPLCIAHCNFQLRGEESEGDELFVAETAQSLGVPFFVKRFDTSDYAKKNGLSIQMAARKLRYEWFAELAETHDLDSICTAHHLNDSVETALLNFIRGTSLPGISGIAVQSQIQSPSRPIQLVRPLLFITRNDILNYAQNQKILWREDSSNASDDYARNLIRHQVVPHMETLNPNFIHTAARNMRRIRAADENLSYFLNALVEADHSKLSIDKQAITRLPSPRQAIRQLLKPYGFDAEQTRQLSQNLEQIGLEIRSETGYTALIDRHKILVSFPSEQPIAQPKIAVQEDDLMLGLPDGSRLFLMPGQASAEGAVPTLNIDSVAVDAEKLQFPLHLRHWQPGDYFQPLGMEGKRQKLQDFFTNQKLSRFEKDAVWLLVNGDDAVIWVIGHRLDERFKIQPSTKKTLKINLL